MARPSLGARLYQHPKNGQWILRDGMFSKRLGVLSETDARSALDYYVSQKTATPSLNEEISLKKGLQQALRKARDRAALKKRIINVGFVELADLYVKQKGRCAASNLPFNPGFKGLGRCNPYGISIDRIDNKKGYVEGNVRLVLTWINNALADYGDAVMRHIVANTAQNTAYMVPQEQTPASLAPLTHPSINQ